MQQRPITPSMKHATANFHDRAAKAYADLGKHDDAKSARRAARLLRKNGR